MPLPNAILLAVTGWDVAEWEAHLRALAPERDIRVWPDRVGDPADIAYACVWKAPPGVLATLPNLQAIFSLGAGVDHLTADTSLPDVPIVRIVDRDLTLRMTEYIVLHVLMIHRRQHLYDRQQRERVWRDHDQPAANDVAVGVMGLGALGGAAAKALQQIGFNVAGWSRTRRHIAGIASFHGPSGLDAFLARTEILVVLLPLTSATEGILNLDLFGKLRRSGALGGAHLINAGRGHLQIDDDIVAALDRGLLASATLDVFPVEPLPPGSPLWTHPRVTITPHNAATSNAKALTDNVMRQIARIEAGLALQHVVERRRGY